MPREVEPFARVEAMLRRQSGLVCFDMGVCIVDIHSQGRGESRPSGGTDDKTGARH